MRRRPSSRWPWISKAVCVFVKISREYLCRGKTCNYSERMLELWFPGIGKRSPHSSHQSRNNFHHRRTQMEVITAHHSDYLHNKYYSKNFQNNFQHTCRFCINHNQNLLGKLFGPQLIVSNTTRPSLPLKEKVEHFSEYIHKIVFIVTPNGIDSCSLLTCLFCNISIWILKILV